MGFMDDLKKLTKPFVLGAEALVSQQLRSGQR